MRIKFASLVKCLNKIESHKKRIIAKYCFEPSQRNQLGQEIMKLSFLRNSLVGRINGLLKHRNRLTQDSLERLEKIKKLCG